MKLAFMATFAHPDHHGGAERMITETATRLAGRGHEVTLITSNPGGSPEAEQREGVAWRRYACDRSSSTRFYRSAFAGARGVLRELLARNRPDLISLHQLISALAAVAPGMPRLPRVLSFYAPYHQEYLARHREGRDTGRVGLGVAAMARALALADRHVVRRVDEILVLSRFSASQLADLGGRSPVLAPPGIDLERFRPAASAEERRHCRRELGLVDDGVPLVVCVRRLVPRMGLPDLIEGLRLARKGSQPGLRLAIAGSGPEREDLDRRIEAAGLTDAAILLGRVPEDQLPLLYRAASLFVLPTRSLEGFGMVTAEALASGLPVIATRVGANIEVLKGVPGARLIPPEDPSALAAALSDALADADALAADGHAARKHAEQHLTWNGHLDAFEAAAERAVARHAGPGRRS